MADNSYNIMVSNPVTLFTMSRSFKACSNGKIFIGLPDTDPSVSDNQIPLFVENEDGSTVQVSQPLVINSAGYPVYNGQVAKFVTTQNHSMAVYDSYMAQQFYWPQLSTVNPSVAYYEAIKIREDLSSPDDGLGDSLIAVKQPFTGAIARTQHDKNAESLSVFDFGAKGDGASDDTESIQKAIDAVASLGGGVVRIPAVKKFYSISKPLLISDNSVSIVGCGSSSNHDNPITMEGSIIKASAVMDHMIKVEPLSTTRLNHNNIIGLFLDGNNLSSDGVRWLSSCQSKVDIDGKGMSGSLFNMGCSTNPTESRDPQNNDISLNYRGDNGIILNCTGIKKSSSSTGVGANCSMNTFSMIKGVLGTSSAAINLIDADNNIFKQVILYYYGSSDNGAYLEYDKDEGGAYNNTFEFYSSNKKIYGTGGGNNRVLYIDSANGTPLPVWGERNLKEYVQGGDSPIGYETYKLSQESISAKKSNGIYEFKGKVTIPGNSTVGVTFPTPLPTYIIGYGVSAVGVSPSFIVSAPTLTGISLSNQNSGEVTVYWWAEGY
ncbi:phage tailspike protein [Tatumella punctata]|uniref:Phage tailspike protein n=1 Tax=Tatumella punctata TaxID=399969 RepID=A0ABW1VMB0_9GAMM